MEDQVDDYRLQKALRPPRATTYTAQALYEQIQNRDIDLEPEYQRDVVWTEAKQIGIIDSILRNFYIPPIILAVKPDNEGFETKTCIDGKQRLTSIYKFMNGLIPHRDPMTNEKFWYIKNSSVHQNTKKSSVRLLPEKYRRSFSNKQIVCVEYQDLTDANERDIFQRVQLGMALTPAEKLHVINTPRAYFIRSILESYVERHPLGNPEVLLWDRSRGSDFRCVAQAVFIMSKWGTNSLTGSGSLPQVERWLTEKGKDKDTSKLGASSRKTRGRGRPKKHRKYNVDASEDEEDEIDDESDGDYTDGDYTDAPHVPEMFSRRVKEVYNTLTEIATNDDLNGVFHLTQNPKVSPIEMICIPVLIYVHGVIAKRTALFSAQELANAIEEMRVDVRQVHKDIRMNDRVGKTMIEFIHDMRKPVSHSISPVSPRREYLPDNTSAHTPFMAGLKRKHPSPSTDRHAHTNPASPISFSTKPTLRRKIASLPSPRENMLSMPTPPWTILPRVDSPESEENHLLAERHPATVASDVHTIRSRHSLPNPQRLPSPDPSSSASSSFVVFQSRQLPGRPDSLAKSELDVEMESDLIGEPASSAPNLCSIGDRLYQIMGIKSHYNQR
ncbi:hypothetical protein K435DRAFT_719927 [Dendrothele bispora CBS 962.96]|uniref:GmrSD restriction endonucleases N-terminal domain-containing protein n=1 Tax=Dendrothele bispora (strain CBS 962.96) TaxID=1314807 RepID=A0A4S8MB62_DENBC|nr:hypothetical protein K435DRAFT_719927 [Dendrothele bispora CBS 962.96]